MICASNRSPFVIRLYSIYGKSVKRNASNFRRESSSTLYSRNNRVLIYMISTVIGALGATYASVPLYKIFCQKTGFGGTTQRVIANEGFEENDIDEANPSLTSILKRRIFRQLDRFYDFLNSASVTPTPRLGKSHVNTWTDEDAVSKLATLKPVEGRPIRIYFTSCTSSILPWTFNPTQSSVRIVPGETALCFFTATNNSDKPITGVATYNVHPPKAGLYFNKVQCFCFEEQRLLPGETVDMPVFFYIDPEIMDDPYMDRVNNITLSYTFFKTDEDYDEENDEEYGDD